MRAWAGALLVLRDVEEDLDDRGALVGEHALELLDVADAALTLLVVDHAAQAVTTSS